MSISSTQRLIPLASEDGEEYEVPDTTDTQSMDRTPEEARLERRIKLKLDCTILPLLASIQFLSQMAKSDLGNAKTAGMNKDMSISEGTYSLIASMLLIGYVVFQIPGTLLIRKFGPAYQFGTAMISWGIFTICLVAVKNIASMMALRLLTGGAEAFIHGTLLYLSFWYKYDELATRGAIFTATASLAGAFNGLLSHAIQLNLDGKNGWAAWRWIFFVEGLIPIGWGFVIIALLPSTPETVKRIFTSEEKRLVIRRSREAHNTGESKIRPKALLQNLSDPTFWLLALIDSCIHFTETSLPNFLPSIIQGIGWGNDKAQLMSSIVYVCASVSIIFWARVADKTGQRGILIIVNCSIGLFGFILLRYLISPQARFGAVCLLTTGVYPCVLLVIIWLALSIPGYTHRSSAAAMVNMIAQVFGILGNFAYTDGPLYHRGLAVSSSLLGVALLASALLLWRVKTLNKKKYMEKFTIRAEHDREKSIDEIGNKHPDFYFSY